MRRSMRGAAVLAVVVLAVAGLAACGDDDDDGGTAAPDSDVKEYCDATLAIETVDEPDIDFESLTPEQQQAEAKKYVSEKLRPLADKVVAAAPEEIKTDIDVLSGAVDEAGRTGDFDAAFEKPEVERASDNAHEFDLENCDWGRVDATALDYAFDGIDDEVDAGAVSFDLKNEGTEMHEMAIFRKAPGTTETFDELLEMEEEEVGDKIVDVAHVGPTKPGDTDYSVANLEAGEYLVACFFPVGSTPEKFDADEEVDGPPHFTRGMKKEFKVA